MSLFNPFAKIMSQTPINPGAYQPNQIERRKHRYLLEEADSRLVVMIAMRTDRSSED